MEALWDSNALSQRPEAGTWHVIQTAYAKIPGRSLHSQHLEGVLDTEIEDAGRTPDSTTCGEEVDEVTKSITEGEGCAVPDFAPNEGTS